MWEIGKNLLKREYSRALVLVNNFHWVISADIVKLLKNKILVNTKQRVAKSYISIEVRKLAEFVAMSVEDTTALVNQWGWNIKENYVFPVQAEKKTNKSVEEYDILLITQLVGFLEQQYHIGINN